MALMAQILITIIQVNFVLPPPGLGTKLTRIIIIKICAINLLPSQPFLGCQLGFHNFFMLGHTFFYSLAVFV